jgi:hypothetical protein
MCNRHTYCVRNEEFESSRPVFLQDLDVLRVHGHLNSDNTAILTGPSLDTDRVIGTGDPLGGKRKRTVGPRMCSPAARDRGSPWGGNRHPFLPSRTLDVERPQLRRPHSGVVRPHRGSRSRGDRLRRFS